MWSLLDLPGIDRNISICIDRIIIACIFVWFIWFNRLKESQIEQILFVASIHLHFLLILLLSSFLTISTPHFLMVSSLYRCGIKIRFVWFPSPKYTRWAEQSITKLLGRLINRNIACTLYTSLFCLFHLYFIVHFWTRHI